MADNLPTPRDSLLERYVGEARTIFLGDRAIAVGWLPVARVLQGGLRHYLAAGGVEVGSRRMVTGDGTVIDVHFDGAQNIITIDASAVMAPTEPPCPLRIESGIAFAEEMPIYDNRALMEPFTLSRASTDDYNPPLSSSVLGELHAFTSPMPSSGQPSRFLGRPIRDLYAQEPDPAVVAVHRNAIDAEGEALYDLAVTCSRLSPSMFSGKIQLWIQAILGYKDGKDRVLGITDIMYFPPYYIVDGYVLHFHFQYGSSGVFVDDDYQFYFLITMVGGTVSVTPLEVKELCSHRVLVFLRDHKAELSRQEISKLEALILARAKLGDTVILAAPYEVESAPFGDYGWHFDWNGNRANLITHESIYIEESLYVDHFVSRSYAITFSLNPNWVETRTGEPLYYAFAKTNEIDYYLSAQDRLYWYDYRFRGMRINTEWTSLSGLEQDFPFYCFYNKDDTLVTIRYLESHEFENSGDPNADAWCFSACMDNLEPPSCNWKDKWHKWGDVLRTGFYPDNVGPTPQYIAEKSLYWVSTDNFFTAEIDTDETTGEIPNVPCPIVACFTSGWWSSPGSAPCYGHFLEPGDPAVAIISFHGPWTWTYNRRVNSPTLQDTFLALSLFDSEAVYIGCRDTWSGSEGTGTTVSTNTWELFRQYWWCSGCSVEVIGSVPCYVGGSPALYLTNYYTAGGYGMDLSYVAVDRKSVQVTLVTKHSGNIKVVQQTGVIAGEGISFFEREVFGNSREYPLIDWFVLKGERGVQDGEIVYTNGIEEIDASDSAYGDDALNLNNGNYIGWA